MAVPTDLTSVGVDPNHWFPLAREADVVVAKPLPVTIAGRNLVVFRAGEGTVAALEDRCCHRKLFLSRGIVAEGCVTCPFHGWTYEKSGRLKNIPYWPAGRPLPKLSVQSFPVRREGTLYWVFLGSAPPEPSPELFERTRFDPRDWLHLVLDRTFHNHYAFGIINGMDFTHFFLHRKFQPWSDITVQKTESSDTAVRGTYNIALPDSGPSKWLRRILRSEARNAKFQKISVEFLYPHHFAWMGDEIRVGAYFSPVTRTECRVFIDMLIRRTFRFALLQRLWFEVMRHFVFWRIQDEDAWIGEREQESNDAYPGVPRHELNPISIAVERLLWLKWSRYCEKSGEGVRAHAPIVVAEGSRDVAL
jgi:phenylpropionate dioxygenase-like ring-hydroxylating dioxygenase large terminal subunit